MKNIFFILYLSLFYTYSFSQSIIEKNDTTYLQKIDLISNKIESTYPAIKENIDLLDIEKKNVGQDIPALLKYHPSIIFSSDAGNGIGYSSLRLRGSDQTRINVTINGVPLNDSESHNVYYVDIPDLISSASSIQIQRGVGVSTIGNGSFGGQIDIATLNLNKIPYGNIEYSFGSYGSSKKSVSFGSGLLKSYFSFDGRISHIKSDGYIDRGRSDLKSYYVSGQFNNEKTLIQLISFGGIEETYQCWSGGPISYLNNPNLRTYNPYTYENQIDHYTQIHHQAHVNHIFTKKFKISATLHFTHGKGYYENYDENTSLLNYNQTHKLNDYFDQSYPEIMIEKPYNIINRKWLDNDFFGFILKTDYNTNIGNRYSKKFSNYSGLSINKYNGRHFGDIISIWEYDNMGNHSGPLTTPTNYYYDNFGDKTCTNVYSRSIVDFGNLSLSADLQFQYINYKINGNTDDQIIDNKVWNFAFLNPKFGIRYSKQENHKFFGSFSVGSSEPNRSDLIENENNSLKAEKLYDSELQYLFRSDSFIISTGVYYMQYKDQLVLTGKLNDVGAPIRTNVKDSYRLGLEVISKLDFHPIVWSFNLNISDNKIRFFNEYIDNWNTGEQQIIPHQRTTISFSPNLIASSSINLEIFKNHYMSCNLNFDSKYVSQQFLDNTNNTNRSLPGYAAQDLSLSVNLKNHSSELKIKFLIVNLFNSLYSSFGWTYPFISTEDYVDFDDPYLIIEDDEEQIYEGSQSYNLSGVYPQATRNYMLGIQLNF